MTDAQNPEQFFWAGRSLNKGGCLFNTDEAGVVRRVFEEGLVHSGQVCVIESETLNRISSSGDAQDQHVEQCRFPTGAGR